MTRSMLCCSHVTVPAVDSRSGCLCCRTVSCRCYHGRRRCRRIKTSSFNYIQVLLHNAALYNSSCLFKFIL